MDVAVMEFVEAARLRGEGRWWIIFREILPNTLSPLLAEFGLRFAFAVLFLSTLSFLGLGIQPPEADWGGIVKDNKSEEHTSELQSLMRISYAVLCLKKKTN